MKNNKLDKSLLEVVSTCSNREIECIAYVSNIEKAKQFFSERELVCSLPFIGAVGLKIKTEKLLESTKKAWVKTITKQSSVMALMDVARKILGAGERFGRDVTIAYIDTGIAPHVDFLLGKPRICAFVDLVSGRKNFYDDNGHGTFVSGVGSGNGAASGKKFMGIAPQSNIISIKALNEKGEANAVRILEAMQWVDDNQKKFDIKVVCMSFGSEPLGASDPMMKGAEVLWNRGITMVAAAGNSGPEFETIKSPGISPRIITVGGLKDNRKDGSFSPKQFEIAPFSSRGPAFRRFKPDLVAPSVNITSCSNSAENLYTTMSGTSVATPMVAGLAALILESEPSLSPDQVKFKLMSLSRGITFNRNLEGVGYPLLS